MISFDLSACTYCGIFPNPSIAKISACMIWRAKFLGTSKLTSFHCSQFELRVSLMNSILSQPFYLLQTSVAAYPGSLIQVGYRIGGSHRPIFWFFLSCTPGYPQSISSRLHPGCLYILLLRGWEYYMSSHGSPILLDQSLICFPSMHEGHINDEAPGSLLQRPFFASVLLGWLRVERNLTQCL